MKESFRGKISVKENVLEDEDFYRFAIYRGNYRNF